MNREGRRKIPRRQGDNLVRLTDGIISEILLRLPVKCVLRFKCVCTGWLSLISCPLFVKSHLERGVRTTKILAFPPFKSLDCQLLDLEETRAGDAAMDLPMPTKMPEIGLRILGSCDGLVAFRNGQYIFLFNPATRMFLRLPRLRAEIAELLLHYGIGYDLASDDYKVIVCFMPDVVDSEHTLTVDVFSLKSNAWRERSHQVSFKIEANNDRGVFVGDAVHWTVTYLHLVGRTGLHHVPDPTVFSMRMCDESIVEVIQLPVRQYNWMERLQLVALRSQLALHVASPHGIEVWIMNEYGVRSSWTRLYVIRIRVMPSVRLLDISRRGDIIFNESSRVWVLEPRSLRSRFSSNAGCVTSAVAYTESLVSPPGFQPHESLLPND